jgi:hypothetical protein
MEIKAQIVEGIRYKPIIECNLTQIDFDKLNINSAKSSCSVSIGQNRFAVSKWVSPKRTRSYPYERVYNTFSVSKRITVIPIVKDEGENGDRDFLQWDTISLMSLLDVYIILAYYETAEKHRLRAGKITNQRFNNEFVRAKIEEISTYHSSALHWNLKELKGIPKVLEKIKTSHKNISEKTKVSFHNEQGLNNFAQIVKENLSNFMDSSRLKAQSAQSREFLTIQPKEVLATQTKAKITISNYLGGMYFFTVDEIVLEDENLFLIESKYSNTRKLPSVGDIKDGLLKMMLYTNLENVTIDDKPLKSVPILKLTSGKILGVINSDSNSELLESFYGVNNFSKRQREFLKDLFNEAKANNFTVSLGNI